MKTLVHNCKHKIEYSIVNVSELEGELRIDAEYYNPVYLRNEKLIKKKTWKYFNNKDIIKFLTNGHTPYKIDLTIGKVKFITAEFVKEFEIDFENSKRITRKAHFGELKSTILQPNDLLITIKGKVGVSVVVPQINFLANINQDVARVVLKKDYNPEYISAFFNSKYGKLEVKQLSTSQINPFLGLGNLRLIKIPIPSPTFQKQIEKLVLTSYKEREKAENLYKEAENILLEELELKNWKPKTKKIKVGGKEFEEEENISIRKLPECLEANRFDAEYWEPKYDEIENLIKNYKGGCDIIKNRFNPNKTKVKIDKESVYNYIEIGSINVSNGEIKPLKLKGFECPANTKFKLSLNDLLISKVRTYRGAITFIFEEIDNLVASGAFTVLQEKDGVNKEILFLLLRTKSYLIWSLKFNTGSSYPTLNDEDIINLIIPLINQQIQSKISLKIQKSFKARRKSKELLEIVKRGVEIYIENDEQKGINYIKKQL